MRPIKTMRNESGFTLVEVMVTVALLMILILGIGAMVTVSFRADTYNQERHVADKLAQMVLERLINHAAQGSEFFDDLVENNFNHAVPAQPAIPGVRPAIPAEPPSDRIYADFDGDGVADYGFGSKTIYCYQLLIDDIPVGGQDGLLKLLTLRIYYANQTSANPAVDLRKHPNPGGQRPRRFEHPLTEVCTYVALP
jgi:type II secretory pathway pseudopilin PulG